VGASVIGASVAGTTVAGASVGVVAGAQAASSIAPTNNAARNLESDFISNLLIIQVGRIFQVENQSKRKSLGRGDSPPLFESHRKWNVRAVY
jgi:hypothetical protein